MKKQMMKLFTIAVFVTTIVSSAVFAEEKSAEDEKPTQEELRASISEKLLRDPRPQLNCAGWDVMDYPVPPGTKSAKLEDCRQPGTFVDLEQATKDQVAVVYEINSYHSSWKDDGKGEPPAVTAMKRAYAEYSGKGVQFIGVFRTGHYSGGPRVSTPYAERLLQAKAYVEKHAIPGTVLVDKHPKNDVLHQGGTVLYSWLGRGVVGNTAGGLPVFIRNRDGRFVYRGFENVGFGYHAVRLILDRVLDKDFDAAVRSEFYPEKKRELPRIEKRARGLAYIEDFESYKNNHDFKLQPRWGFRYDAQSRVDLTATLVSGKGRGTSAHVSRHPNGYVYAFAMKHQLPAPLTDGYIRFHLRRRDLTGELKNAQEDKGGVLPVRSFQVRFGLPNSYDSAGNLFATGGWLNETFVMNWRKDQPGRVKYSKSDWHEIVVTCKPGEKAIVTIDGKEIGRMRGESIDRFAFRIKKGQPGDGGPAIGRDDAIKGFYIDDVEVFYAGDADKLLAAHRAARPKAIGPVEPFTEEENAELYRSFDPIFCGTKQAELGTNSIRRADVVGPRTWGGLAVTMDHPIPVESAVFMDAKHRGEFQDIIKKHKGKVVYIRQLGGSTEGNMRQRATSHRSFTTFNRNYRLWSKCKDRDIVFIGMKRDVGHRTTVKTLSDLGATAMDYHYMSDAIGQDLGVPRSALLTSVLREIHDEVLLEHRPNWWPITFGWSPKHLLYGGGGLTSFMNGMSDIPHVILNRKGEIVYRANACDGMSYWEPRAILDCLYDEDFDAAIRQEFRNPDLKYYRSPLLPQVKVHPEGLTYTDDFESYADSYDFILQPRWGFNYFYRFLCKMSASQNAPMPFKGEGRNGSQAVVLHKHYIGDTKNANEDPKSLNAGHHFPEPLANGHFRFFVRRGPIVSCLGGPPLFRLAVTCLDENENQLKTLTTFGPYLDEEYVMAPTENLLHWMADYRKSFQDKIEKSLGIETYEKSVHEGNMTRLGAAMPGNDKEWQEIRIVCRPGQKAAIHIDGKQVAELASEKISGVELRSEVWSSFWVDDAELFYAGGTEVTKAKHAQRLKDDLKRRQKQWEQEADDWQKAIDQGGNYLTNLEKINASKKR